MTGPGDTHARLIVALAEAEAQAWESLARYKYIMFGYWAGQWVLLNRTGRLNRPSPFRELVAVARRVRPEAIPRAKPKPSATAPEPLKVAA